MAKGNNDKPKKYSYRPYDQSNSLVQRITNRVSEILPQSSSWMGRWLMPADPESNLKRDTEDAEEEVSAKRRRLNHQVHGNHQNHVNMLGGYGRDSANLSPIPRDDRAVAGPSGLQCRRDFVASTPAITRLNEKVNGDEGSDSSESTSGCSSLVPQTRNLSDRAAPGVKIGSPSLGPQRPQATLGTIPNKYIKLDASSSRGRPTFDPYVFNNPLHKSSSLNVSHSLNVSQSLNVSNSSTASSPFYHGRTMYGGSSSCQEALSMSSLSPRVVNSELKMIRAKPTQSPVIAHDTSIGTSAMKILKALEQFSNPVQNVKRELVRPRRRQPQPFQELVIPSMPDLLRIKRKQKPVQTESSETSTPVKSSTPVTTEYQLPPPIQQYSLREDDDSGKKPGGSVKGKNNIESERVPPVNLPNAQLNITSMPVFTASLPKASTPAQPVTRVAPSSPPAKLTPKVPSIPTPAPRFKFSTPLYEPAPDCGSTRPSLKFSEPSTDDELPSKSPKPVCNSVDKNKEETDGAIIEVKNGFGDRFKPPAGSWTCSVCSISNGADKVKCAACETAKPSSVKPATPTPPTKTTELKSLAEFKPPAGSWECKECLVSNPASSTSCAACSTAKPGATNSVPPAAPMNSFVWKKPEGWECTTCLVSNKTDVTECVACNTPKPGSAPKPAPKPNLFGAPSTAVTTASLPFTFGVPVTNSTETKPSVTFGGFKFGGDDTKKEKTGGFNLASFGSKAAPKGDQPFTFGVEPKKDKCDDEPNSKKRGGFSSPSVVDPPKDSVKSPSSTLFGAPTSSSDTAPASNLFKFGSSSTVSSSTDTTSTPSTEPKTTATFSFAATSNTNAFSSSQPPTFGMFSNNGHPPSFSSAKEAEPAPNPTFNTKPEELKPTFDVKTTGSLFGMPSGSDKPPSFNCTDKQDLKPNHQPSQPFSGGNKFEMAAKPFSNSFQKPPTGGFPTMPTQATPFKPPTFGCPSVEASAPKTSFGSFAAPAPANPFRFNSPPVEEKRPVQPFTFGAAPPQNNVFNSTPSEPIKFGVQPQQPSLFGTQSGFPGFGAPQATEIPPQQTFGAVQQPPPEPQPSLFGFAATPVAPGGFSFSAQNSRPAQPQPPTFNPNIEPNFNFSGGAQPPTFSAQSDSNTVPTERRIIRKAVRRTPRPQ